MEKSTISMAIFNSYVKLPEGSWPVASNSDESQGIQELGQRAQSCGLSHQLRSVRPMKEWSSTPFTGTTLVSLAWITFIESILHMGVSENSVPLKPMVNDHYPY